MAARKPRRPKPLPQSHLLAQELLSSGVDPRLVARATKLPIEVVARLRAPRPSSDEPDPELHQRALELGDVAIRRAEYLLEFGAPQTQLQLIRTLVTPLLTRKKDDSEDDERIDKLRSSLQAMMEDVGETRQVVVAAVDQD